MFTTIWKGSNILKLYSVFFYQTCKFDTIEKNIRQKRSFLCFKNDSFLFVFSLYFHLGWQICMFDKSKLLLQNTILNRWTLPIRLFKNIKSFCKKNLAIAHCLICLDKIDISIKIMIIVHFNSEKSNYKIWKNIFCAEQIYKYMYF